ncbi:hypothetical protein D9613_007713 [Agrocybe pediades]|uniref:Uncharacterized protein n=1 Tax=Agrocybe pediades TaxID=84607 RepID=A0A8H4QN93_9AGAR|nr:hypothetical protein D9613_007713 [Agrocybe pediades]KAF9565177.1 hypothetical protein CPC08DRAFT_704715 [Agrocybe pediades]
MFSPAGPSFQKPSLPPRIPQASHRHAAPAGPWPWSDLVEDDVPFVLRAFDEPDSESASPEHVSQSDDWRKYPALYFPNWTQHRVARSGIAKLTTSKPTEVPCIIYQIDVDKSGHFLQPDKYVVTKEKEQVFWEKMTAKRGKGNRVRLLFLENLSGSVLQMLGTIYKIEPFFFSSSLNWIPSRYQEDVRQDQGDHITITLTFLRTMPNPLTVPNTPANGVQQAFPQLLSRAGTATIDTQAPLILRSNDRILLLDLLAFHMIRRKDSSTIISYHPTPEWQSTTARYLHSRVRYAGESVYWQSNFRQSEDPTFVLLCMLWYALYAWDEALENLYVHICWLESRVLITNDIHLTRELHIIRASLLHYASLLDNFRKTVLFLRKTPNPAMHDQQNHNRSADLMNQESDTLVSEIERLEMFRKMQEMRLENVMNLAFASVNFQDSRDMQRLSEASLRDGAVMKQISYLTMVFLPATFVATIFGMNISSLQDGSLGTPAEYLAVAIPLTAVTIWVIVGLHSSQGGPEDAHTFVSRLQWPYRSLQRIWRRLWQRKRVNEGVV